MLFRSEEIAVTVDAESKSIEIAAGSVSGIEIVEGADGNDVIYDLSGRSLKDASLPGIYMKNGKKILKR